MSNRTANSPHGHDNPFDPLMYQLNLKICKTSPHGTKVHPPIAKQSYLYVSLQIWNCYKERRSTEISGTWLWRKYRLYWHSMLTLYYRDGYLSFRKNGYGI